MSKSVFNLTRVLSERNITKAAFARATNIHPGNVAKFLDGNPTVQKIQEIANALDMDVRDMFFPIDEPLDAPIINDGDEKINTADNTQVGFFVFGGKKFKIVEVE